MKVRIHTDITEIPRLQWNALVDDNYPFVRHEFLAALESCGCVGEQFGWLPRHIAIYDDDCLVGAMPLYEKFNSYGEFVFDNAWADAYVRQGLKYFPKLVCAVPYTPATGKRFLAKTELIDQIYPVLFTAAMELARSINASSVHWLFPDIGEHDYLAAQEDILVRHDCQFHWHNRGYSDFDDFLQALTTKKRKNIRQERRRVQRAGVRLRSLDGYQATIDDWSCFDRFYQHTFETKWGIATLNKDFFVTVARDMPESIVLILAESAGENIAGALMYQSDTRLYGRFWGADRHVDALHFEACYYQGIEHCIARGLQVFEPGAQGEHKISRGFSPVLTRSAHWVQASPLQSAIGDFCQRERQGVREYMQQLGSPYRDE